MYYKCIYAYFEYLELIVLKNDSFTFLPSTLEKYVICLFPNSFDVVIVVESLHSGWIIAPIKRTRR